MKGKGWRDWEINERGELYHRDKPDLVFTSKYLEGLEFYFESLADQRRELQRQVRELEKVLNMPAPPKPIPNIVIFPRYTRQRP